MVDKKGVEVRCHRCKYEWTYTGKLWYATCPSCQIKVNIQAQRIEILDRTEKEE